MKLPFKFGEILLPKNLNTEKWGVVACDQFTSNPDYWQRLEALVQGERSALNLIYPECYLESGSEDRIAAIEKNMLTYLDGGVFEKLAEGVLTVRRKTSYGNERNGVMCLVDLDEYSYLPEDNALIRATEGTVTSRIPPRVKIRENCPLELPHVMLLIDDADDTVLKAAQRGKLIKVYGGKLNMDGGEIEGYLSDNVIGVTKALETLAVRSAEKYGAGFLFAVGDGNHSLAAAKSYHELHPENMLAKYALVEVVNIYDKGLKFEPIHRAVFDADSDKLTEFLKDYLCGAGNVTLITNGVEEKVGAPESTPDCVKSVDLLLSKFVSEYGGSIDYIHGEGELKVLSENGAVGIKLPKFDKSQLFDYVVRFGALPRKTFSMGEAEEKRYYIEARKIKN